MAWIWRLLAAACLLIAVSGLESPRSLAVSAGDSRIYSEAAHNIVDGDGYTTDSGTRPRFPPGFPLLLTPFAAAGDVLAFPPLAGIAFVLLLGWTSWSLAGPAAAAVAGLLAYGSTAVMASTRYLLADLPASLLLCAAMLAVLRRRELLAGVLVGLSATLRLGHGLFAVAARRWGWVGSAAVLVPLVIAQFWLFGSLSSYPEGQAEFGISWLWEHPTKGGLVQAPDLNVAYYPQLLAGRWGWLVPGLPLLAGAELWLRRRDRVARWAATIVVANVALYLAYWFQSPRFMLPSAMVLIVFAAAFVARPVRSYSPQVAPASRLVMTSPSR